MIWRKTVEHLLFLHLSPSGYGWCMCNVRVYVRRVGGTGRAWEASIVLRQRKPLLPRWFHSTAARVKWVFVLASAKCETIA